MSRTVISKPGAPLDDRQRVSVEQLVLEGAMQDLEQAFPILRFARQERRQPLQQGRFQRFAFG
jgi:hypothetical protein